MVPHAMERPIRGLFLTKKNNLYRELLQEQTVQLVKYYVYIHDPLLPHHAGFI